jgi:tRNA G10  N-methylase Trm11
MLPAIAARAVATYTAPGDLVLDPMCGVGTTLVETVHQGRDAIGVEYEHNWAELARANLALATAQGATGAGEVAVGDARHLSAVVAPAVRGLVSLVLTSPPYGSSVHGRVRTRPGQGVHKSHYRYSADPANLAHVGTEGLLAAMQLVFAGCRALLKPGGFVVVTARPWWRTGELVDFPGALVETAAAAGLDLYERNVALLAGLRAGELVPRVSFFALDQVRRARQRSVPRLVTAHEDLLVFRPAPAARRART